MSKIINKAPSIVYIQYYLILKDINENIDTKTGAVIMDEQIAIFNFSLLTKSLFKGFY